jgi:glyoxylase-like metal-dependent hydrolase (beta-lactamase superfamily II)
VFQFSFLWEGVSKTKVKDSPLKPYGVTGETLRIFGQQTVAFAVGGHTYDHTFVISELPTEATGILGMDFLGENWRRDKLSNGKFNPGGRR